MMDARLQSRIQRYGWDLAARDYDPLWQWQLAGIHAAMLASATVEAGERVLDVACGTGLVACAAAGAAGRSGTVLGTDLSARMIAAAQRRASEQRLANVRFARMDAQALELADASVDVVLCALGLMYVPEPERALREMQRVLRPGGRLVIGVWGERARCGWSAVFPIVDAEVASEVCPLFFRLGRRERWKNCVPMRISARSGIGESRRRWPMRTPAKPVMRRLSAARSRWHGRDSTRSPGTGSGLATSKPSARGDTTKATGSRSSSSLSPQWHRHWRSTGLGRAFQA
jgi:ubiquinone/menaquinone biosynthesis C-methylase UbiE